MKLRSILPLVAMAFGLFAVNQASANPLATDLTASDYISYNGLDWAWASPVDEAWGGNVLYTPEFHEGWRYATVEEWANRPEASAFYDINGSLIVASKYWNSEYDHADYGDAIGGYLVRVPVKNGTPEDIWYVRGASNSVPDAASTFGLGLLAIGALAALRRRF